MERCAYSLPYFHRGQFSLALATTESAAHIGSPDQQAPAWLLRAWIYQRTGMRQQGYHALHCLHDIIQPDSWIAATARFIGAQLAIDEGDLQQVRSLLDEALVIVETTGHAMLGVDVRMLISRWHYLNDDGAALEWAREAVTAAQRLGSRYLYGQALRHSVSKISYIQHDSCVSSMNVTLRGRHSHDRNRVWNGLAS